MSIISRRALMEDIKKMDFPLFSRTKKTFAPDFYFVMIIIFSKSLDILSFCSFTNTQIPNLGWNCVCLRYPWCWVEYTSVNSAATRQTSRKREYKIDRGEIKVSQYSSIAYKIISLIWSTGWPVKPPKLTCPVYDIVRLYTGQVTFSKEPEKHGHAKLVTLYIMPQTINFIWSV